MADKEFDWLNPFASIDLQIGDGTANIMKMIIAREKSGMRLT